MFFFVFTFISGLVLLFTPVLLMRYLTKRWNTEPKTFWKAGFAGMVSGTIVLGVILNIGSAFPGFTQMPDVAQALVLGLMSGLLVELGRFLVLDRMMPSVRGREQALVFGLGWPSIAMLFLGALFIMGAFGMYNLLNTQDFAASFPNAGPEQLELFDEAKKQIEILVNGSPLKALSPLLEYAGVLATDAAMTLLIVFGLRKKQTRYAWFAVGWRALLSTSYFFNVETQVLPIEMLYCFWALAAAALMIGIQKKFPSKS
jgi:uncharacterized membrane protein YhfC